MRSKSIERDGRLVGFALKRRQEIESQHKSCGRYYLNRKQGRAIGHRCVNRRAQRIHQRRRERVGFVPGRLRVTLVCVPVRTVVKTSLIAR